MKLSLADLQQALTSRVNEMRRLQRLVESKSFAEAYDRAADEDRSIVHRCIRDENRAAVEQWVAIQERSAMKIEELPVRDLRRLACSLRVEDYNYLSRASLLSEITKVEIRRHDTSRLNGTDRAPAE